ncbi:MAG: hypothetical protein J2P24_19515, partial [Streptosporangiales bacterium]|nr:hypothetical protein [Streptosporangiales bacterium]
MPAEIAESGVRQRRGDQLVRGSGEHDLPAVRGRGDAGSAMHVHADVAVLVATRLTGVQAHPHPDGEVLRPGVRRQRPLPVAAGTHRVDGRSEDHEEAVALGAHLHAVVLAEHRAQDRPLG